MITVTTTTTTTTTTVLLGFVVMVRDNTLGLRSVVAAAYWPPSAGEPIVADKPMN